MKYPYLLSFLFIPPSKVSLVERHGKGLSWKWCYPDFFTSDICFHLIRDLCFGECSGLRKIQHFMIAESALISQSGICYLTLKTNRNPIAGKKFNHNSDWCIFVLWTQRFSLETCKHGAFLLAVLAVRIVLILQGAETHRAELEIELSSTCRQSQHWTRNWCDYTLLPILPRSAFRQDNSPLHALVFPLNSKPDCVLAICSGALLHSLTLSFSCGYQLLSYVIANKHNNYRV